MVLMRAITIAKPLTMDSLLPFPYLASAEGLVLDYRVITGSSYVAGSRGLQGPVIVTWPFFCAQLSTMVRLFGRSSSDNAE